MLDADSVFERLLREAANLVPKMSTPKLTAALKVSSSLQQRITDTISTRINQEQNVVSSVEAKQFGVQGIQSIVSGPIISDDMMTDTSFLSPNETFTNRSMTANYGTLPFFPQLNQFAVSQRTATLVTITNPGGGNITGATMMGTLSGNPGTAATLIQHTDQTRVTNIPGSVAGPVNNVSLVPSPDGQHFNSHQQQQQPQLVPISSNQQQHPNLHHQQSQHSQQSSLRCTTSLNITSNGHLIGTGEGVDLKPDPVACLARAAVAGFNNAGESLFSVPAGPDLVSLGFMSMPPLGLSGSLDGNSGGLLALPCGSPSASNGKQDTIIYSSPSSGAVTSVTSAATVNTSNNTKGGPYECLECGKEFRILRYLDKHKRIHTGEKPYQCCYCGRQFNDWPNMNRHKRIHTGERPYRCSVCTKTFSQPAVYNEHVKRHTGERPYICTVCAKGFPRSARLAVHMRVHTGERPYACSACDRRFSQPHHLAAHERIHNGDRPFPCSKCDVTFVCISNLRRHRRQAHPGPPVAIAPPPPLTPTHEANKYVDTPSSTTGVSFMSSGSLLLTPSSASSVTSPSRTDLSGGGGPFQQQATPSCTTALATTTSTLAINDVRLLPLCSAAGDDVSSNELICSLATCSSTSPCATTTTSVLSAMEAVTGMSGGCVGLGGKSEDPSISQPSSMIEQSSANGGGSYLYDTSQHQQMANGTIFVSSLDGTSQCDHLGALHSTPMGTLVSSSASCSLPQIQIQQLGGMPIAQFSFAGSDKLHSQQHQTVFPEASSSSGDLQQHQTTSPTMTPIQICYSTGNPSDPGTLVLQSTNNTQLFSGHQSAMLVPIAAGGFFPQTGQTQQLPILTPAGGANWTSTFQTTGSPATESTHSVTPPTVQASLSRPSSSASLVRDYNPPTPQLG